MQILDDIHGCDINLGVLVLNYFGLNNLSNLDLILNSKIYIHKSIIKYLEYLIDIYSIDTKSIETSNSQIRVIFFLFKLNYFLLLFN